MKQALLLLSNGKTYLEEMPLPHCKSGHLLIKTSVSLISKGTESTLASFGKDNYLNKIKKQPEKVSEVLDKAKTDGIGVTLKAIKDKIEKPAEIGYCNVGTIIEVGEDVKSFKIGDRVLSNGPHAEVVCVPENLCTLIPENLDNETACFGILGSIGLQGIRLANPTFGETFLVIGLGLIGLLTAQLLIAQGCNVLGLDPDKQKQNNAKLLGIKVCENTENSDILSWIFSNTGGLGSDGVFITAATTSDQPIDLAAKASRKLGRIILIGVSGLHLKRDLFYKKELSFQVSCSYGPGRYDDNYELKGNDYPIGYVRWTEKRNIAAVLEAMSKNLICTKDLISHRYPFEEIHKAYDVMLSQQKTSGIILKYKNEEVIIEDTLKLQTSEKNIFGDINPKNISFIGSGNYTGRYLLPAFKKGGALFNTICANNPVSPTYLGNKFNFIKVTTDVTRIFEDKTCNAVIISSRHDTHATFVIEALRNGKHVFVEKPLCLNIEELQNIQNVYDGNNILMIGYNRRFSPITKALKSLLDQDTLPKTFIYTCNAGHVESSNWIHDSKIGGGRLIGEACHFVDLIRFLAGSPISDISLFKVPDKRKLSDNFTIQLSFENGSIGSIHYFSSGNKKFPKERVEVFSNNKIYQIDNFKKLNKWGVSGLKTIKSMSQNKGQEECAKSFLDSIKNNTKSPIEISEIFEIQSNLLKIYK